MQKHSIYKINDFEKQVLNILQYSLPVVSEPFRYIGDKLGFLQEKILETVIGLIKSGIIKRIGTILSHHKLGYTNNTLVLWEITDDNLDYAGECIASYNNVSHCYTRKSYPHWNYSLYSMIHSSSKENRDNIINDILLKIGNVKYIYLESIKEFKKERLLYFSDKYQEWNNKNL